MNKKFFSCFFILALLAADNANTQQTNSRPNILFVMSDDHAAEAIGIYKSRLASLNPTPNIDRMAKESMVFTAAYCNNSICTPARASILTGQYSQTNGSLILEDPLPPERQYLPMEMKKLGYSTAIIGKWHLVAEPAAFDYYKILNGQGTYFDPDFFVKGMGTFPKNIVNYKGHSEDVITDQTLEYLKNRDKTKPFFLAMQYKSPHDNFEFAPRYADYLKDVEIPEPASLYDQPNFGSEATRGKNDSLRNVIGTSVSSRHPFRNYVQFFKIDTIHNSQKEATHLAYQEYLKRYLRCVKGIDDNIQRIFDYLKANDLWNNTIIIYTSDQGFMLGEHDYIDKRWMYEPSMQIPFIVHYPKLIKKYSENKLLINNTDIAPTLIEMAGGKKPAYMQGESFASLLKTGKNPKNWRDRTYYRYWMHLTHHDIPAHFGIRSQRYKLIFYYGLPYKPNDMGKKSIGWAPTDLIRQTPAAWEFYDLAKDPNEVVNQYNNPRYKKIIQKMKAQLIETRKQLNETDKKYPHIQAVIDKNWNK